MENKKNFDPVQISSILQDFQPREIIHPLFKLSAILIPLIFKGDSYSLLLTSRSSKLRTHKGEMSFPGGRFDPEKDKTLQDTALRETQEEIGIKPENVKIIGRLDDFPTITGYVIRPFIGILLKPIRSQLKINIDEVENVIEVPISHFLQPSIFKETQVDHGYSQFGVLSVFFEDPMIKRGFNIWGATAHIISAYIKSVHNIRVTSENYRRPTLNELAEFINTQKGHKKAEIKK